jgi:secreted PhoX family phosphatase
VWVPCAGSVTPWQTHLGSEEYPPDAKLHSIKSEFPASDKWPTTQTTHMMRYWDHYNYSTVTQATANALKFNPYQYGYPWETVVKKDFTEKTTKLYAHGRMSYEMAYVMPDQKTVYHTDDGNNCVFTMMKLKKEKDLKEGTLFCMKMTQTSPAGGDVKDFKADIEFIEMPTPTHDEAKAAIPKTTFQDLFEFESCNTDGTCPTTGFKSINVGIGVGDCTTAGIAAGKCDACECLKVKAGKEKLASVFEKRRYAAYLGCTAELYRWEGITYDADSKKAYTAISNVDFGMNDGDAVWDKGGPNHIKTKANVCGCVMEMDIDAEMKPTKARMLVCGKPLSTAAATAGDTSDKCDIDSIANPDNVAVIPKAKQVPPQFPLDTPRSSWSDFSCLRWCDPRR